MEQWKKGCFIYLAAIMAVIGLPFLFMIIVDPYNISMLVTTKHINATVPDLANQSRLVKAAAIIRTQPDTIIIGTSIVDGAFVIPGSTYHYDINRAEHHGDYTKAPFIFNAGIRGGVIEDGYEVMKHAYANNPHLKHVIAGYEWGQFTKIRPLGNIHDTDLFGQTSVFPFGYKKYFTWIAFDDALHTLEANNNISRDAVIDALKNPYKFIKSLSVASDAHAEDASRFTPIKGDNLSEYIITAKNDQILSHNIYFAYWSVACFSQIARRDGEAGLDEQETLETLRKMVEFAHENHITFTLYLSPQPPLVWAMVKQAGLMPYYEQWLRNVAQITPFYDYSRLPQLINDDAHTYFWYDTVHFLPALGEQILPPLLRDTDSQHSPYYITKDTVDADIAARKNELDTWLQTHQYLSEIIKLLDFKSDGHDDLPLILPTAYNPVFHGFRLIRHLADQFIGVPATNEPYDFQSVINHDYRPMFTGKSLDDVARQIQNAEPNRSK